MSENFHENFKDTNMPALKDFKGETHAKIGARIGKAFHYRNHVYLIKFLELKYSTIIFPAKTLRKVYFWKMVLSYASLFFVPCIDLI